MRKERDMEKIKIKYLSDKIERLRYIDGKSGLTCVRQSV